MDAQGYQRYSNGVFVALAALQKSGAGRTRMLAAELRGSRQARVTRRVLLDPLAELLGWRLGGRAAARAWICSANAPGGRLTVIDVAPERQVHPVA